MVWREGGERDGSVPLFLSLSGLCSSEYFLFFSLISKPVSGTWMVGHVVSKKTEKYTLVLTAPLISSVTSAKVPDSS